jgi:CRP-like cAMP-binding protein
MWAIWLLGVMSYRDWSTELASFALFHDLPPEVIEQVAVGIRPEQCAASTKLIQADEESRHIFLVRFGSLKVVARPESLNPVVLALLGQGAIIGELGAVQVDHGRSAEVIALEECRLFMTRDHTDRDVWARDYPGGGGVLKSCKGLIC